jgi:hypothetical protein
MSRTEIAGQESPCAADCPQAAAIGKSRAAEGVHAENVPRLAASSPKEVTRASGFADQDGRRQTISVACLLTVAGVVLERTR